MIGIVIVSHSQKLAEGVVELAKIMAPTAQIEAAGGLDYGRRAQRGIRYPQGV